MHVKQVLVFRCFIFKLNKVKMYFNEIHIVCASGKIEERKIYV
jgi:hypothetical protein